jgi:hypothetical protein
LTTPRAKAGSVTQIAARILTGVQLIQVNAWSSHAF